MYDVTHNTHKTRCGHTGCDWWLSGYPTTHQLYVWCLPCHRCTHNMGCANSPGMFVCAHAWPAARRVEGDGQADQMGLSSHSCIISGRCLPQPSRSLSESSSVDICCPPQTHTGPTQLRRARTSSCTMDGATRTSGARFIVAILLRRGRLT